MAENRETQAVKIQCRPDQNAAYRLAAAEARLPLRTWIKQTLDHAAAPIVERALGLEPGAVEQGTG